MAPLPALLIGIVTMRALGVSTSAWSINVAATVIGLVIWAIARRLTLTRHAIVAAVSIVVILLPFAFAGSSGVHRWISLGGFRLHASVIVAPLLIACVARASLWGAFALSAVSTAVLALHPDAAQATSFAGACIVIFALTRQTRFRLLSAVVLVAIAAASFIPEDPLSPVPHVEGIFAAAVSRGPAWAVAATVALFLLPIPFFVAWQQHRNPVALALGVYVALTILASAWGTFPVPIMGYGASPILGYFIALGLAHQRHLKQTLSIQSS